MASLKVNGRARRLAVEPDTPLLWALRDGFGLTGTKFGCGRGLCGACTVLVDGQAVRSCTVPVSALDGSEIVTIEGLAGDPRRAALIEAWVEGEVAQCGYCQPGQIMTAAGLLAREPDPSEEQVVRAMSGNLCRCGAYGRICRAVRAAAGKLR